MEFALLWVYWVFISVLRCTDVLCTASLTGSWMDLERKLQVFSALEHRAKVAVNGDASFTCRNWDCESSKPFVLGASESYTLLPMSLHYPSFYKHLSSHFEV